MQIQAAILPFNKWKPIEILLAVLFVASPFYYHPIVSGAGLKIPNNISVWLVIVIVSFFSLNKVLREKSYVIPRNFILIVFFPVLITLSGFVSGVHQPIDWLFRLLYIWGGLILFFALFQHGLKQGRIDRVLLFIVVSGFLHSVMGISQIYFYDAIPIWLPQARSGAPSSFFLQVNNHVTFQATIILIAFYLSSRPLMLNASKFSRIFLFTTVFCSSFIVFISDSLIGLVSLLLSLFLLIPVLINKKNKFYSAFLIGLGLTAGAASGLYEDRVIKVDIEKAADAGYAGAIEKISNIKSGRTGSNRYGIYSISIDLIKQEPLFGHGIGSFAQKWQNAKPSYYQLNPSAKLPDEFLGHPHNEIILHILEGGVLAGVAILLVITFVLISLNKAGFQRGVTYLALLLPITLHTQTELPFYTSTIHWALFIFLLFVIANHHTVSKKVTSSTTMSNILKTTNLSVSIFGAFFLIQSMLSSYEFSNYFQNLSSGNQSLYYTKSNPYYKKDIQWLEMGSYTYNSMAENKLPNVLSAAQWYERYVLTNPTRHTNYVLLDIYEYLQDKSRYCDTFINNNQMYPNDLRLHPRDQRLLKAIKVCGK